MKKFTREELLGIIPISVRKSKELTKKQLLVLGQLMFYSELEQTKDYGFFYRSNKDLCNDVNIAEPTLISALIKLEHMGFIKRHRGKRGNGASEYVVLTDAIDGYNTKKQNFSNQNDPQVLEMADRIRVLEDLVKNLSDRLERIETANFSTDTDTVNTDTDTDLQYKGLYNKELIDNNILNNKNNIFKYNNIIDKEKKQTKLYSKNLKEKGTDAEVSCSEPKDCSTWLNFTILDPTDFDDDEEETEFINDLNKRIAYARWDSEEEETA